ncbi:ABC transporter ATP-binding protein [Nonomuraea africana]|uniref:ABC transporter ATP-binding protein n=1 Tax=Nonomuraea africana TaxID=46171 RepID=UPI003401EEB0
MNDVLLDVSGLHVEYADPKGPVRAVTDVSFTLRRGEVLGVAGESGCGKSTLITALLRLQRPPAVTTAGSAIFHPRGGVPVDLVTVPEPELRRLRWEHLAIVFQSAMNALNPVHRLGAQFVDAIRAHRGGGRAAALARAEHLLGLVGIPADRVRAYPHELSGGMRQRATIALAMACEPDLVVMDEPTTAVDVVMQRQILRQITRLRAELGFTVVFVTHDLSLLIEIADRIAIMYGGRIVELAPARAIYDSPLHPYARGLRDSFPPLHGPRRELRGIPGSPPDLRRPITGCAFAPRCPERMPECERVRPELREHHGHEVACLLHHKEAAHA